MELTVTWSDIEKELSTYTLPNEHNEVVLFGAGFLGETEAPLLKNELNIVAISDNDPKKWKKEIAGIPCIAPEKILQYKNVFVMSPVVKFYPQIAKQMQELGISHCTVDAYVVSKYLSEYAKVYQMLDETSRHIYAGMLLSRIQGDASRIPYLCEEKQYFALPQFRFCGIHEVFVDCGAYTGENSQEFIQNQVGVFDKIYAFESNPAALMAMQRRLAWERDMWLFKGEQIVCERKFVGREHGQRVAFHVMEGNPTNSFVSVDESDAEWIGTVSLDGYFAEKGEERITFLKADIEGAEWDMLHGGQGIIQRSKPKMALSIYHNIYDFFRIPLLLKEWVPEYRFAVRQHWNSFEETVLYCYV